MCGIAGFILREGLRPEPERLEIMVRRLGHRGPDDWGMESIGPVGLAQTRLAIIGLDSGHQPMLSPDGRLALVANGEVYNYLELNAELGALGYPPRTASDSESILNAYAAWGLAGFRRLHGMYAFALYDAFSERLILGRDRLGIKPLFYLRLPDRIAFASELKALLAILPEAPQIRPAGLRQFLQNQFAGGDETLIAGIRRVPPGTVLVIDPELRIQTQSYWSPLSIQPRRLGLNEALDELDALLATVMREHQRCDVPFGLFLSGGLDSGVIAAKLAEQGVGRIKSYSIGYRGTRMADELNEAARVAAHLGFAHEPLAVELDELFRRLPYTIWCADELMRDYACLPTSLLAERAGRELKVVFSGEGGDEVFAGYRRYRPSLAERWLKGLIAPGSGGFRTRGQWDRRWVKGLMGPELQAAAGSERVPVIEAWRSTPTCWSDLQRRQYTDLVTALPDNLLVKTDRMLMGFGVEGRVPFLDHRLVEFGLSLPDDLKMQGRQGKWLLRRWAEPRLPPDHLARPKRGFHVPVGDWLRGERAQKVGHRLAQNPGIRAWFRVEGIPELVFAHRQGHGSRELFGLMQFAIWYRMFIEQPGLQPTPDEDPLDWI